MVDGALAKLPQGLVDDVSDFQQAVRAILHRLLHVKRYVVELRTDLVMGLC